VIVAGIEPLGVGGQGLAEQGRVAGFEVSAADVDPPVLAFKDDPVAPLARRGSRSGEPKMLSAVVLWQTWVRPSAYVYSTRYWLAAVYPPAGCAESH
jgi:hypothetical protein